MNKTVAYLVLIVFVILTIPIFFITIPVIIILYNALIRKRNQVELSFSGVDVALQKRSDLIPNVVEGVKKYMFFEQNTLKDIVALRSKLGTINPNSTERFELENELTGMLKHIMVTVESYPELKSSENMLHLQRTLNELEEQISAARRAYNASVNRLNNAIETFPSNIVAGVGNFKRSPYFQARETAKDAPNLNALFND